MRSQSRQSRFLGLAGMVVLAVLLGVIWAVAPEDARGLLILAGGAITVALYLVLYAVQRRRHWGS